MKRVKLNVKVKNSNALKIMEKSNKREFQNIKSNPEPQKKQSITNNYYNVQNLPSATKEDLSESFMRDARRYSYSLEVQL